MSSKGASISSKIQKGLGLYWYIENRRAIARSANTGVSAFINKNGEIVKKINYNEKGILIGNVELETKLTFYAKYGDYIARIALLMFILTILFLFKNFLIKK